MIWSSLVFECFIVLLRQVELANYTVFDETVMEWAFHVERIADYRITYDVDQ